MDDHVPHPRGQDRRQRRSDNTRTALQYQLDHAHEHFPFEALVLCDDLSTPVAAVGRQEIVTDVSIQSPWLIGRPSADVNETLSFLWDAHPDLTAERVTARAIPFTHCGRRLILVGVGEPDELEDCTDRVAAGVRRIIGRSVHAPAN